MSRRLDQMMNRGKGRLNIYSQDDKPLEESQGRRRKATQAAERGSGDR